MVARPSMPCGHVLDNPFSISPFCSIEEAHIIGMHPVHIGTNTNKLQSLVSLCGPLAAHLVGIPMSFTEYFLPLFGCLVCSVVLLLGWFLLYRLRNPLPWSLAFARASCVMLPLCMFVCGAAVHLFRVFPLWSMAILRVGTELPGSHTCYLLRHNSTSMWRITHGTIKFWNPLRIGQIRALLSVRGAPVTTVAGMHCVPNVSIQASLH
jgi:hypothetical protein